MCSSSSSNQRYFHDTQVSVLVFASMDCAQKTVDRSSTQFLITGRRLEHMTLVM